MTNDQCSPICENLVRLSRMRTLYYFYIGMPTITRKAQRQTFQNALSQKSRHGETGTVQMIWDGQFTRFSNMEMQHEA